MRTLGTLEASVLVAVRSLGEEAYGLGVRREVSRIRAHDYSVGAIYTTLRRLEKKGLLTSRMSEPLTVRGGRARREYRLSGLGERAVQEDGAIASRLWSLNVLADSV